MPVSWSESQAETASFLAVVPPRSIVDDICAIRARAGHPTFHPHVTVKAQPNLERPDLWRPAVASVLAEHQPFVLSLGGVAWFGEGIIYFEVGDEIVALHESILDAIESVDPGERFEYEGDGYVPHLTLGGLSRTTRLGVEVAGETFDDLQLLAELAESKRWPPFEVDRVVEFRREGFDVDYEPVTEFILGDA